MKLPSSLNKPLPSRWNCADGSATAEEETWSDHAAAVNLRGSTGKCTGPP